jgi:steroid delta-isomerase-like uncharacterized protein
MTTGDRNQRPLDESLVQQWVERALEAFNTRDVDRFVGIAHDDVVFDHSASPTTIRGLAEVRSFYDANWKAFPDARLELDDGPFVYQHRPNASFLWRSTGANTGPLEALGLPPTGKRAELSVCEFAEFRDGLLSRTRIIIDMVDFLFSGSTRLASPVAEQLRIAASVVPDHLRRRRWCRLRRLSPAHGPAGG